MKVERVSSSMDQWNLLDKNISHSRTQNGSFEDWIFSLQGDFFMRSWHDTIVAGHISHVRSDGQPGAIFYKKRRWRDSALLPLSLLLFFLRFCSSRSSCLVLSVHCLARSVTIVIRCTARRGKKFTCYRNFREFNGLDFDLHATPSAFACY